MKKNDNEKVYNLFNKVYGENVSIIFIDSGFGILTFINDNMVRQVDLYIMLQSLSVIYKEAIDIISIGDYIPLYTTNIGNCFFI